MTEILSIWHKTPINKSINQSSIFKPKLHIAHKGNFQLYDNCTQTFTVSMSIKRKKNAQKKACAWFQFLL